MIITEAVDQFLADLASDGRSPHTVAAYRRDLKVFIRFAGDTIITDVTPAVLTAFMATQGVQVRPCGASRAKASINRYRVSLKALFAWCGDRWLIERNPTSILKCRRHRALPPEILTKAEVAMLTEFSFGGKWAERDRTLIQFMLATGCRLGETVTLSVGDIDFERSRVILRNPKGGEPETVPMTRVILDQLCVTTGDTELTHPLFRTGTGNRLSCRQVQRIVARRCIEAGIKKTITPHSLRHTFATKLYNQTGDIRLVQVALRHESIATTQTYAQLDHSRLQTALGANS
ncbi:MAG: tyrosine-type recombinase/integrase [Spirochaetales bacterium]|nr:tyrosine-type recombinase/integrase [Spirochaetales bacterium]